MHLEDGAKVIGHFLKKEIYFSFGGKSIFLQMSFDDLGQIYTNISRKRILSKVSQ